MEFPNCQFDNPQAVKFCGESGKGNELLAGQDSQIPWKAAILIGRSLPIRAMWPATDRQEQSIGADPQWKIFEIPRLD
jgi:hypothetical protein